MDGVSDDRTQEERFCDEERALHKFPECPNCNDNAYRVAKLHSGVHYAAARCGNCGYHLGWLNKPEADPSKYRREASHRSLVKKYGKGYCEMCLTAESDLPNNETLEGHHVIEYKDGGKASRKNTWIVCTSCHKLINWRRTYIRT